MDGSDGFVSTTGAAGGVAWAGLLLLAFAVDSTCPDSTWALPESDGAVACSLAGGVPSDGSVFDVDGGVLGGVGAGTAGCVTAGGACGSTCELCDVACAPRHAM